MSPRRLLVAAVCLALCAAAASLASAQGAEPRPAPPPGQPVPRPAPPPQSIPMTLIPGVEWQMKLMEADKLLALGNLGRAEEVLKELAKTNTPRPELLPRWLTLAQKKGDHQEAAKLCREGLARQPGNGRLLRELARELMAMGKLPAASAVVDSFMAGLPDRRSGVLVGVELWQEAGHPAEALALVDSARGRLRQPQLFARQRAACLIALGRAEEGADELVAEVRAAPVNLPLVRADLLGLAGDPETARRLARRFATVAGGAPPAAAAGPALLAASLDLTLGEREPAEALTTPLLADRAAASAVLQTCAALLKEGPLLADRRARVATSGFLLAQLERLASPELLAPGLRVRVLDLLAQAAEDALQAGTLTADPDAAVAQLGRVLTLVAAGNPGSAHLTAAEVLLARYERDVLRRPAQAAERLQRLLADMNLSLEGVAIARLALGECYLAARDTAKGREVLTRLARTANDRVAAGSAHFDLARLDLAEGHWETARDRLAALALDNPSADYANDALALGLAVAEELGSDTGGPAALKLYARGVYYQLLALPDSQATALETFVTATAAAAGEHPSPLLAQGRYELAVLYRDLGRPDQALAQCERIVLDHPEGRYPGDALALEAEIHLAGGDAAAARAAYQRLLVQYPDYLFADEVRDRMRNLP